MAANARGRGGTRFWKRLRGRFFRSTSEATRLEVPEFTNV
jgi:hypothetical protein